ncbi:helix-turn-helix transcriptional regulator [Anaerovibrio lipolyticus]|uniref:helix-turn-helix domain-containing protein n=1 Tax=Anaerovibrio lipolyticus TaxID=82374 RepID=UPI001F3E7951|nr:helix-turn-helix transcriptional regulator [Anaerovibrio lipolyticus]MCF2601701.1 helix-turn-helix transcriptional regulator [Anaerovibrio lipolyticus]
MTHPAKIAYFRSLRGITQEELASRISVNKSVISRIERGQYNENVGIIMLWSIANALKIDMSMLVTFTEFEKDMWLK